MLASSRAGGGARLSAAGQLTVWIRARPPELGGRQAGVRRHGCFIRPDLSRAHLRVERVHNHGMPHLPMEAV
jgi:hypothetical protein